MSSAGSDSSLAGRIPTSYTIPDPASVEEFGRTFQAYREDKYILPNDGDEQDRLDIQHKAYLLAMKGHLYWAPIGKPNSVLDIGTGTGIWAIHFAQQHSQAKVTATDLSLIQPANAPQNCTFIRDDAEEKWIFEEQFDYIHLRFMVTCFDHPRDVLQNIYNSLRPGGHVEYLDSALEIVAAETEREEYVKASPVARCLDLMKRGLWAARKRDTNAPRKYKQWMLELGFVNVVEQVLFVPVNSWPQDPEESRIGRFMRLDFEKAVEGMPKIFLAAGLPQQDIPAFIESVKRSLGDAGLRAYNVAYVVYGQKPGLA